MSSFWWGGVAGLVKGNYKNIIICDLYCFVRIYCTDDNLGEVVCSNTMLHRGSEASF